MNYTKLFYWLTVADNARTLFQWGINIFTIILVISIIINFIFRWGSLSKTTDGFTEKSDTEREKDNKVANYSAKWIS